MIAGSTVILVMMLTLLVEASPFAREKGAERRILGIVRGWEQFTVRRQRHLVNSRGAAGRDRLFDRRCRRRIGSITLSVLSPSPA